MHSFDPDHDSSKSSFMELITIPMIFFTNLVWFKKSHYLSDQNLCLIKEMQWYVVTKESSQNILIKQFFSPPQSYLNGGNNKYSKVPLSRPHKIKTTLAIKTTCFSTKMQFSMQMGLINETCLLLGLLSTSTVGGLSGTSLYLVFC